MYNVNVFARRGRGYYLHLGGRLRVLEQENIHSANRDLLNRHVYLMIAGGRLGGRERGWEGGWEVGGQVWRLGGREGGWEVRREVRREGGQKIAGNKTYLGSMRE